MNKEHTYAVQMELTNVPDDENLYEVLAPYVLDEEGSYEVMQEFIIDRREQF